MLTAGAHRPSAADSLLDPYFTGLHNPAREPCAEPISKLDYEFEKRKLTVDEVRDLIYREVLEYHPQAKREYTAGETPANFVFPSAVDNFKRQFAYLEGGGQPMTSGAGLRRQAQSLPREQMVRPCTRAAPAAAADCRWCMLQAQYRHEASNLVARADDTRAAQDSMAYGVQAMSLDERL